MKKKYDINKQLQKNLKFKIDLRRSSHQQVFYKNVFLKISQNSEENTCVRASFLKTLQSSVCNFIKKDTLTQVFSCEPCEISLQNTYWWLLPYK